MAKFALVTGASGEIGTSLAKCFAAEGYSLYLHYHSNEAAAIKLRDGLERNDGQTFEVLQADLSVEKGANQLAEQIHHPLDLIVHNSGMSYIGLITDMTDIEIQKMVQLHVTAPLLLTKTLLPAMISRKYGKIVVISSIWGLRGASMEVVYSTAKGALNSFVKALAKEVAPSGISVNGIAPGAVSTKMLAHLSEQEKAALREDIPMGRFGRPQEIADLAVFLASDKAAYINGEIISINGAWF